MGSITLSRTGDSVTIPLLEESGTPLFGRQMGKPNLIVQESGSLNPRVVDQWSVTENFTFTGRFIESDAYEKAIRLCDLFKRGTDGTPMELTATGVPEIESEQPVEVVPAFQQDQAVTVEYPAGFTNHVLVDATVSRVGSAQGAAKQTPEYSSPLANGSGPIVLSAPGEGVVSLREGVTVARNVGRPNSSVNKSPDQYPLWIDKRKSAYDGFELAFEDTSDSAESTLNTIVSMFRERPGRDPYTLDFNGAYGLGQFNVTPEGSDALRHIRTAGEEGVANIPAINLRVVRG